LRHRPRGGPPRGNETHFYRFEPKPDITAYELALILRRFGALSAAGSELVGGDVGLGLEAVEVGLVVDRLGADALQERIEHRAHRRPSVRRAEGAAAAAVLGVGLPGGGDAKAPTDGGVRQMNLMGGGRLCVTAPGEAHPEDRGCRRALGAPDAWLLKSIGAEPVDNETHFYRFEPKPDITAYELALILRLRRVARRRRG
jgi:hypothetical protein